MFKQLFGKAYQAVHGAAGVPKITVEDLKQHLDRREALLLLDVREPWEYDLARIEGAKLIPMQELPERLGELDKEQAIAVYCHVGGRSARVVKFLVQQGFKDVVNLSGGIDAWAERIDPGMKRY